MLTCINFPPNIKGQKIKEELRTTNILLKEYQETINARNSSERIDQGTDIQRDLENSDAELQGKVGLVLLSYKMTSDCFAPLITYGRKQYIH